MALKQCALPTLAQTSSSASPYTMMEVDYLWVARPQAFMFVEDSNVHCSKQNKTRRDETRHIIKHIIMYELPFLLLITADGWIKSKSLHISFTC